MNVQVGEVQNITIHGVSSVSVEDSSSLESPMSKNNKYYRTMVVRTEDGKYIEITLFSRDYELLRYKK